MCDLACPRERREVIAGVPARASPAGLVFVPLWFTHRVSVAGGDGESVSYTRYGASLGRAFLNPTLTCVGVRPRATRDYTPVEHKCTG